MKHFHHTVVGNLELAYESVDMIADPGLSMTIYVAEPASPTAHALDLLASWASTAINQPVERRAMTRTITAVRVGVMLPALALLAACSNHGPAIAGGDPTSSSPSASDVHPLDATTTDIRILIDGRPVRAQLADNPTARAFADRLPLTLSFRDLNGVEKIAKLAEPLTTDGVPDGD